MKNQTPQKNDKCIFFEEQNNILKLIFVFLLIFSIFITGYKHNLAIYLLFLIYFIPCFNLLIVWLKLSLKIIPLFITLYLAVLIFKIDFIKESFLVLKIWFLLLISVYISHTTKYFRNDISFLLRKNIFNVVFNYFITVINFTKVLIENFTGEATPKEAILSVIKNQEKYISADDKSVVLPKRSFWNISNIYLMIFFTVVFLILEI